MGITTFRVGQHLRFMYHNHRGENEMRKVIFQGLDYGSNEWYREPQWFMRCHDIERNAIRSFSLARIDGSVIDIV